MFLVDLKLVHLIIIIGGRTGMRVFWLCREIVSVFSELIEMCFWSDVVDADISEVLENKLFFFVWIFRNKYILDKDSNSIVSLSHCDSLTISRTKNLLKFFCLFWVNCFDIVNSFIASLLKFRLNVSILFTFFKKKVINILGWAYGYKYCY